MRCSLPGGLHSLLERGWVMGLPQPERRPVRTCLLAVAAACLCVNVAASDWPQFRGANHDGTSPDPIQTVWQGPLTNSVWTVPARNGFSSFAVASGLALTQVRRTVEGLQKEVCVALSITNGAELWSTVIDEALYDAGSGNDDGPRTTPTIASGAAYVLSSRLKLFRLNLTDGAVAWKTNLLTAYGGTVIPWQNSASPLLEAGCIYLNVNSGTRGLLALRSEDGGLAWRSQESGVMTHATPVITTMDGVRQVIFATQKALVSLDAAAGNRLWTFPYPFRYSTSLAVSPVVDRDMVFISGAYAMGSCAARVSFSNGVWSAQPAWSNDLESQFMTPVCYNGYLYGHFGTTSSAPFKCVAIQTGDEMWSVDGFGCSGTVLVNHHIVALTQAGALVLIDPTPEAYVELGRFQAVTGKCWNGPAICDGRVYVRSTSLAACYDLSAPALRLNALRSPDGGLDLTLAASNGTPLSAESIARTGILTTTNLSLPIPAWIRLPDALTATNGSARLGPLPTHGVPGQFYRAVEEPALP